MNLLTNQIARFKTKRFIKEIREADLKQIKKLKIQDVEKQYHHILNDDVIGDGR